MARGGADASNINQRRDKGAMSKPPPPDRAVFTLILQPTSSCDDPVKALRWVLKTLLRTHKLRCISIKQTEPPR
jgi:hypothetical protein